MAPSNNIAEKMNRHNDHAGKKRTTAGIIQNTNSFSCLDTEEIIARSKGMGVNFDHNDFDSVNLISDLEHARVLLYNKKSIPIPVVEVENADSLSEIIESESSDWEDFVLVTPKRTRKTNRKFLFSVSNKKAIKPSKEIPCNKTGAKLKGISDAYKKAPVRNNKIKGKT